MQGLNNASKDHLVSAGLSTSEANKVISERGSCSFKNIVDAYDRVTSLGTTDMSRLVAQTGNFNALYPSSGSVRQRLLHGRGCDVYGRRVEEIATGP